MKNKNTTFSIGNAVFINKVDDELNYFDSLFKEINGRARNLVNTVKLLVYSSLPFKKAFREKLRKA